MTVEFNGKNIEKEKKKAHTQNMNKSQAEHIFPRIYSARWNAFIFAH